MGYRRWISIRVLQTVKIGIHKQVVPSDQYIVSKGGVAVRSQFQRGGTTKMVTKGETPGLSYRNV